MGKFLVEGQRCLHGTVKVNGAKNSALKLMVAALLGRGVFTLENVPQIADVHTMGGVLEAVGARVSFSAQRMELEVSSLQGHTPEDLVKSMRASVQVLGPLLARLGWVEVALPGGCAIGPRPLDIHLSGLKQMGATIDVRNGLLIARAKSRLQGAEIELRYPSVGATENIMMAATLAKGETVIRNAAQEPELLDIQEFLNSMGAQVHGAGTPVIRIKGVDELGSTSFSVMPDRIEAGTYLLALLMTGGEGRLENVIPEHLEPLLKVVKNMGASIEVGLDSINISSCTNLRPFELATSPYPGFPTDLQPQMVAAAIHAYGVSRLEETVFDQRFGYITELKKLGAKIEQNGHQVIVHGPTKLQGAKLVAGDLRAGAALVLAALTAEGESVIDGAHHIDRGYEQMEHRLAQLGAKITRIED